MKIPKKKKSPAKAETSKATKNVNGPLLTQQMRTTKSSQKQKIKQKLVVVADRQFESDEDAKKAKNKEVVKKRKMTKKEGRKNNKLRVQLVFPTYHFIFTSIQKNETKITYIFSIKNRTSRKLIWTAKR